MVIVVLCIKINQGNQREDHYHIKFQKERKEDLNHMLKNLKPILALTDKALKIQLKEYLQCTMTLKISSKISKM